jgi:hypothetical protein
MKIIFINDRLICIGSEPYTNRISFEKSVTKYSVEFLSERISCRLFPNFFSLTIKNKFRDL